MNLFRALTCVFLASLTTACSSTPPLSVTKYVNVYLPDRFLTDCPKTARVPGGTYRQAGALAAARGTDIDNCNAQLREAKQYQDKIRAQEADKP